MNADQNQTSRPPSPSALRQALDHICEGETDRRIAIALCELDGHDPSALWKGGNDPLLVRAWEHYLPRAKEALRNA